MNFIEENISFDYESYEQKQNTLLSYKIKELNEKNQARIVHFSRQQQKIPNFIQQRQQSSENQQTNNEHFKNSDISQIKYNKYMRNKKRQCGKSKTFSFKNPFQGLEKYQKIDKRKDYIKKLIEIKKKQLQQTQIKYRFIRTNQLGYSCRKVIYQDKFQSLQTLNGQGFILISNGTSIYGKWESGEPIGKLLIRYPNGMNYQGEIYNYKHHGFGKLNYPNGQKYVGQFLFGERHGKGILYGKDGKIILGGAWKKNHFYR